jgi:hypothetical protein|eukprot:COSAG05_NODE_3546_length_1998_cov_27.151132_5_plen_70_part_00
MKMKDFCTNPKITLFHCILIDRVQPLFIMADVIVNVARVCALAHIRVLSSYRPCAAHTLAADALVSPRP